jgi:hypothetical protein
LLAVTVPVRGIRRRPLGEVPFGGRAIEERSFGGMTTPARLNAGWFYAAKRATKGEFFRLNVTDARYL